jgi:beta-aspartyl-dipeptidase (metallo-type)
MIKLIKNAHVYAPADLGICDILTAGEKIVRVEAGIEGYDSLPDVEVFDLAGKTVVPGYIDLHEHITGGGGEQGPTTRVPELQLSEVIRSGITTVLGLLGTDGITRSQENLLSKCQSFNELGITAFMLTGAYGYPSPTLTGSIERDIAMIKECVGVKLAVSDHRSSNPGVRELCDVVTAARRGGLIGNCAGLTVLHMGGGGKAGLKPVMDLLDQSDIPCKNILPTHMAGGPALLPQGLEFVKRGGTIDITCSSSDSGGSASTIAKLYRDGVNFSKITSSSDGCGSMPRFDSSGNFVGMTYASPLGLHRQMRRLILDQKMPPEDALRIQTVNPARVLGLTGKKGCIAAGADADLTVWDGELAIVSVFARGRTAMLDGKVIMKGRFED